MAKVSVGVFDNGHGVHPTIICGEQNIVDYLNELFKGTGEEPFTLQDVRVMAAYHNSRWFNKRDDDMDERYDFGLGWPSSMHYHSLHIVTCEDEAIQNFMEVKEMLNV